MVAFSNAYRRLLAAVLGILGPQLSYRLTATLGKILYRTFDPLRCRAELQCQAALGNQASPGDVSRLAEQSFIHRVWNLADLMLAERCLHPGTYARFGGRIPEPWRSTLLRAREARHPVILTTAYYGPFDLLPIFLGYNGIRDGVVYRPHANPAFDAWRRRIRERSGCELIPLTRAAGRLAEILEQGGTMAIVADHPAARRGVPVTFMGLPATANRSVGLLARHYRASVAVAGIRRTGTFRFEIVVAGIVHWADVEAAPDPVEEITRRYVAMLERIVAADPGQYLWAYQRWGEAINERPGAD